jgi:SAM-dependent methyltransferase
MRKVLSLLEPCSKDRVLDVGCGPGAQLIRLASTIEFGCGVDPAEQMIQRAVRTATGISNLEFLVGDSESLPPKISDFNITKVFSNYALHHLSDDAKRRSILNLGASLPDNGRFVLGDLMFSDNPKKHEAMFDFVGYGPESDTPTRLSSLVDFFYEAGLSPVTYVLNPLVAIISGRKG